MAVVVSFKPLVSEALTKDPNGLYRHPNLELLSILLVASAGGWTCGKFAFYRGRERRFAAVFECAKLGAELLTWLPIGSCYSSTWLGCLHRFVVDLVLLIMLIGSPSFQLFHFRCSVQMFCILPYISIDIIMLYIPCSVLRTLPMATIGGEFCWEAYFDLQHIPCFGDILVLLSHNDAVQIKFWEHSDSVPLLSSFCGA